MTFKRGIPLLVAMILSFSGSVTAPARADDTTPGAQRWDESWVNALAQFAIKQNELSRDAIKKHRYSLEITAGPSFEPTRWAGTAVVLRDGDLQRIEYKKSGLVNRATGEPITLSAVYLIGRNYSIFRVDKGNTPMLIEHDPGSLVPHWGRKYWSPIKVPDPLLEAYGNAAYSFAEAIERSGNQVRWHGGEVKSASGDVLIELRCFTPILGDSTPTFIYWLDPSKGYAVVRHVAYAQDGSLGVTTTIDVREVAPGRWFPMSVEETRFNSFAYPTSVSGNESEPGQTVVKMTVSDLELDPETDELTFAAGGLFPDGTRILRMSEDGTSQDLKVTAGEVFPKQIAQAMQNEQGAVLAGGDAVARGSRVSPALLIGGVALIVILSGVVWRLRRRSSDPA